MVFFVSFVIASTQFFRKSKVCIQRITLKSRDCEGLIELVVPIRCWNRCRGKNCQSSVQSGGNFYSFFVFMYTRRICDNVVLTIPEGIAPLELVGLQSKINFIPFTNNSSRLRANLKSK